MANASHWALLVGAAACACGATDSPTTQSDNPSGGLSGAAPTSAGAGSAGTGGGATNGGTNAPGGSSGASANETAGAPSLSGGGAGGSVAGSAPQTDAGSAGMNAGGAASDEDKFGVRKLYPTKLGGREWFMQQSDVLGDGVFQSAVKPTPNGDGSWHIVTLRPGEPNQGARMDVTTPAGTDKWLNVEMTGYVRLVAYSSEQEFAWRTNSGFPHTNPCDGYAYYGTLLFTGATGAFLKEVWHNSGYKAAPMHATNPTTPLKGRWIGLKMVRYNLQADTRVHLELWLDDKANGDWRKLLEATDDGWLIANPFPAGTTCLNPLTGKQKALDVIMTWPYPLVTFRADNSEFDFDKLSVREIAPPLP